jgi:hypothetical protein
MSESFDPYYRWLAIPPAEQPPHYYRLLGVQLFDENLDVIETAADRQMLHLRTFQSGQHAELSQKLLNEIAVAKVCLLDPQRKAAYDAQLRAEIAAHQQASVTQADQVRQPAAAPPRSKPPPSAPSLGLPSSESNTGELYSVRASAGPSLARRRSTQAAAMVMIVAGAALVAVVGGGLALWISRQSISTVATGDDPPISVSQNIIAPNDEPQIAKQPGDGHVPPANIIDPEQPATTRPEIPPEPIASTRETAPPRILLDFDRVDLVDVINAAGDITATADSLPAPAPQLDGIVPANRAVHIQAQLGARLLTRPHVIHDDWSHEGELSLWTYCSADGSVAASAPIIEVRLFEPDGRAVFWRKVEVPTGGWRQIRVPLAWMRVGGGRVAQWEKIVGLDFLFRGDADFWIDSIAVAAGNPRRTVEELRALAFPTAKASGITIVRAPHVTLITNASQLDGPQLVEHLAQVNSAVRGELSFLPETSFPPVLIIFATREEYQAFTPRFAARLAGEGHPPKSGGFTLEGIATSFWEPSKGSLRPVFTHEYVHALLHQTARLANTGEWYLEGLATRYQLRFHPQDNFGEIVRTGIAEPRLRDPLQLLASGKPITQTRYWQAATLHDLLLSDETFAPHFGELLARMQNAGSTDLEGPLKTVLRCDWATLERKWKEHCLAQYSP